MQQKIIAIIAEVKEDPELIRSLDGSSDLMLDAALDSLQIINFILRVEDEFNVEIDFDSFEQEHLKSVETFSNYIAELVRVQV
ncbi:acyl carrier protein [Paenibacillus sp. TH7-28]